MTEIIAPPKTRYRQPQVAIYRVDDMICVSRDNVEPLRSAEYDLIVPHMEYTAVQHLYGAEARASGLRFRTNKVRLYDMDARGLNCPWGYLPYVVDAYRKAGYRVLYKDASTPRARPGCFDLDMDRVVRNYEFRPRQDECFLAIADAVAQGLGGQVDAPPGFGKSDMALPIAYGYRKANIVLATAAKDNVEKTIDLFRRHFPDIGHVSGGKHKLRRITVSTADSLHRIPAGEIDIFIGDESHELVAPSRVAAIIEATTYARMFSLSATPDGRADGAQARLEPMFGPTIFAMDYPEAVRLGLVVPIEVFWHEVRLPGNPIGNLKEKVPRQRHGIWRNRGRNRVIAEAVRALPEDDQVLILVDKIEHAIYLQQELPEFTLCYAHLRDEARDQYTRQSLLEADFVPMDDRRRGQLRNAFMDGSLRRVIATGVWKRAVSFNALQQLFWAAGGTSPINAYQGPGRVSRIDAPSGKAVGRVHDLLDEFDEGTNAQAKVRQRHYRKHGWKNHMPYPIIVEREER